MIGDGAAVGGIGGPQVIHLRLLGDESFHFPGEEGIPAPALVRQFGFNNDGITFEEPVRGAHEEAGSPAVLAQEAVEESCESLIGGIELGHVPALMGGHQEPPVADRGPVLGGGGVPDRAPGSQADESVGIHAVIGEDHRPFVLGMPDRQLGGGFFGDGIHHQRQCRGIIGKC